MVNGLAHDRLEQIGQQGNRPRIKLIVSMQETFRQKKNKRKKTKYYLQDINRI